MTIFISDALKVLREDALRLEAELTELDRYHHECVDRQVSLDEKKGMLVNTLRQADTPDPEFTHYKRA